MKKSTRGFFLSAIAAGALVGTAIRLASADDRAATPAPAASPYIVVIDHFTFTPSEVTVPVGATVTWRNKDTVAHTATSTTPGFDSGNIDTGSSFAFTFSKSGSYVYVCSYHPNMTGRIVVEAAASPAPSHEASRRE